MESVISLGAQTGVKNAVTTVTAWSAPIATTGSMVSVCGAWKRTAISRWRRTSLRWPTVKEIQLVSARRRAHDLIPEHATAQMGMTLITTCVANVPRVAKPALMVPARSVNTTLFLWRRLECASRGVLTLLDVASTSLAICRQRVRMRRS